MSQEIAALDELKGRLDWIKVNWPDTHIPVDPTVDLLTTNLHRCMKRNLKEPEIQELSEDIQDLKEYLLVILRKYPEVRKDFIPTVNVINWLLSLPPLPAHKETE